MISSNTMNNSGLSDAMAQQVRLLHPALAERHADESLKIREAIDTLLNADTDAVFLNFLALLPCLEKLGSDILYFKRPSMLKGDYDSAALTLDTAALAFQQDVQWLQKHLTPKLALPLPKDYESPRAAALAYAEKCNIFKKEKYGSPQERARIMQRLEIGSDIPSECPQIPTTTPIIGGASKQSQMPHCANTDTSMDIPMRSPKKARKTSTRATQACVECRRSKSKCGKAASCVHVKNTVQQHRKAASFPEYPKARPNPPSPIHTAYGHYQNSPIMQSPLEFDTPGNSELASADFNADFSAQYNIDNVPFSPPASTQMPPLIGDGAWDRQMSSGGEAPFHWQTPVGYQAFGQNPTNSFQPVADTVAHNPFNGQANFHGQASTGNQESILPSGFYGADAGHSGISPIRYDVSGGDGAYHDQGTGGDFLSRNAFNAERHDKLDGFAASPPVRGLGDYFADH